MTVVGLALVGEDEDHFRAATTLIDAAVLDGHAWIDGVLDDCRSWQGLSAGETWYKYDPDDAYDVRPIDVDGVTIRPQGFINGEPLKPEAGMWRRVLLLFAHRKPRPDVVVLVRDVDGHFDRVDGIDQVRLGLRWPFKVVVATPEPEVEAWHVAGFVPTNAAERQRLDGLKRKLAFDPTKQSHRLTSHPNQAATDAKRVLNELCAKDREREAQCLLDRRVLTKHGANNGLKSFLHEIDLHVVPTFGGP